jgi:hypothetical protein
MTLTLWRGDQMLGTLIARAPSALDRPPSRDKPPTLSAFLIPASDAGALDGVWQLVFPAKAGIGVQQRALEPDIVAERMQRAATRVTNPGPISLAPMSPEAVAGVSREVQLTVRAADGTVHLPQQIRLEEVRYEPSHYEAALREVPRDALIEGSVWWAFIVFASDVDAPPGGWMAAMTRMRRIVPWMGVLNSAPARDDPSRSAHSVSSVYPSSVWPARGRRTA